MAPGKRAVKSGGSPGAKWCRRGTEDRSRVCTWFASRWRNHQPKRAEKPHSKFSVARRWTALLRGRRLRLPWRIASGSRQPPRGARLMSARERELGELPSPDLSLLGRKAGQGLIVLRSCTPPSGRACAMEGIGRLAFTRCDVTSGESSTRLTKSSES